MQLINVASWVLDVEHGYFPVGARDKMMLWSPEDSIMPIRGNWPYLFKQSRKAYPEQLWMEVIASIIGDDMGINVPKSFPATYTNADGDVIQGSLTEWFFNVKTESFVHARDYFNRLYHDFDNKTGNQHNYVDIKKILRVIQATLKSKVNWQEWIYDMLLFDSIIGNTDRHQENWGIVFTGKSTIDGCDPIRISPLYDNGTSLGIERFPHKTASWDDERIISYIDKGTHHIRLEFNSPRKLNHSHSIILLSQTEKSAKKHLMNKLDFPLDKTIDKIRNLCDIECPVPLSTERVDWIARLLVLRYSIIGFILEYDKNY